MNINYERMKQYRWSGRNKVSSNWVAIMKEKSFLYSLMTCRCAASTYKWLPRSRYSEIEFQEGLEHQPGHIAVHQRRWTLVQVVVDWSGAKTQGGTEGIKLNLTNDVIERYGRRSLKKVLKGTQHRDSRKGFGEGFHFFQEQSEQRN